MHIQSMHKCIYFCATYAQMHSQRYGQRAWRFCTGEKKPAHWRALSYARGLAGVHAPPENVAEDADLLILDVLEAVVLVRVFIAVEAAQANPRRQTIELFHPQLAVVINGIQVAINDVTNPALAGVNAYRCAITQHRQHTVAAHRDALGLVELHTVMP